MLDVDIPKVDIIISEWMGFCLLYEGMLDSVIYTRDKFLKKDGLLFPERAKIYIAAGDDITYKIKEDALWTENEYGINMSCMSDTWEKCMIVETLLSKQVISDSYKVLDIDLKYCHVDDLQFSSEYTVKINDNYLPLIDFNSMILWFEVDFPLDDSINEN